VLDHTLRHTADSHSTRLKAALQMQGSH